MKLFYRISDKSYSKPKLIGTDKEFCLMNFVCAFGETIFGNPVNSKTPPAEDFVPPMKIICDRCERTTVKMISDTGIPFTVTDDGNAGSFRVALQLATAGDDDDLVYFVEDDYLHLNTAPKLLEEGIQRADYVSLYDHPDKYTRFYNGGEYSKVIKTESSHWRFTASTCMTFAAKVKTLKEDMEVWLKYTAGEHPHDHHIFTELGKKGRKLAIPIPGAACHTDLTFSGEIGKQLIEPWAIQMVTERLQGILDEYRGSYYRNTRGVALFQKEGWERLVILDSLRQDFEKHRAETGE